jgi:phage terminase large subunit
MDEHRKYQWDIDSIKRGKPEVVKEADHTCDFFQYYVNDNLSKLGLKH